VASTISKGSFSNLVEMGLYFLCISSDVAEALGHEALAKVHLFVVALALAVGVSQIWDENNLA
jgi:hypothetical protein